MNKKILIAFGISVFLGLGYLAYRKTDVGRSLKAKWIIRRMEKKREDKNVKWDYPEELLKDTQEELMMLDFSQLEMVEKYVKLNLQRKGAKAIYEYRDKMKEKGIYEKTDLNKLELMLYNLFGLSSGFQKSMPSTDYLKGYEAENEKK